MNETKPPKFIILENDDGDEEILRWPDDPEGMIEIPTSRAVWFLVKLFAVVVLGTWFVCWLMWG